MKARRVHKRGTHNVYVVHLSPAIRDLAYVRRLNPDADEKKLCIYVGMTGLDPSERFRTHKSGRKASRWVRDYGIALLPNMYVHLNPMPYDRAVEMDVFLAEAFRKQGYTVMGGH